MWYVHHFSTLQSKKPILNSEMHLAPRILGKGLWRTLKWKHNCNYTFIYKLFLRVGGNLYMLVISKIKYLYFAFLDETSKNYSYVEINHLRNMKGIGCSNIRTENSAIRRPGRKWVHFSVLRMRAGFPCKSPCKGNSTGQDYWVLGVCAHLHMLFPASGMSVQFPKGKLSSLPFFLNYSLTSTPQWISPSLPQP